MLMVLFLMNFGVTVLVNEFEPVSPVILTAPAIQFYEECYYQFDFVVESLTESISSESYLFLMWLDMVVNQLYTNAAYFYVKPQTDGTIDADLQTYYGGSSSGATQQQILVDERYTAFYRFVSPNHFRFMLFDAVGDKKLNYYRSVTNWDHDTFYPQLRITKRDNVSSVFKLFNFRSLSVSRASAFSSESEAIDAPFQTVPWNYALGDYSWYQYEVDTDGIWTDDS